MNVRRARHLTGHSTSEFGGGGVYSDEPCLGGTTAVIGKRETGDGGKREQDWESRTRGCSLRAAAGCLPTAAGFGCSLPAGATSRPLSSRAAARDLACDTGGKPL